MNAKLIMIAAVFCIGCATQQQRMDTAQRGRMGDQEEQGQAAQQRPALSQQEMMEKMKQAATPGPEHAALQPLAGRWRTETKMWNEPNGKAEISTGTATAKWVMGKRFLEQEYSGKYHNEPFQGQGMLGFDNVTKQYVSTWADTMGTGIMQSNGTYNADTRTFEQTGKFSCPISGGERTARMLTHIDDNNSHRMEMYAAPPQGGPEFKMLEITYKRIR